MIQGALENIAIEMGYKLMRMSYSSIIRESEDFGAALVDAEGRGLAEIGAIDAAAVGPDPGLCARRAEDAWRRAATRSGPATSIMHNDAYSGASHGPDVAFIVPVFVRHG